MRDVSRRRVLQGVLAGTATAALPGVTGAAHGGPTSSEIPAPFDEMPTLEDPPERVRELAAVSLPERAIPDEGAIPDYHYSHTVRKDITIPWWAFEAARWRILEHEDPSEVDRWRVEELLMEYAHISERFITPDGRDAATAILSEVSGTSDDTDGERSE